MFPFYNNYPGTNLHEIDLAYILKLCAELRASNETLTGWKAQHEAEYELLNDKVEGLVNSLVDVITPWDSSVEYPIYSIVSYQDQNYIAIQPVPVGVMITNTEYWQPANTAMEQINAIGVNVANMRRHIYYTAITSIEDIVSETEPALMIVNDGGNTVFSPIGVEIPANIDVLFVNGIWGGSVTIRGKIYAGRRQIFDSDITLAVDKQDVGYPEWFGSGAAAIQKCYNTFIVTLFDSIDYTIEDQLIFNRSHRFVTGQIPNSEYASVTGNNGTRLLAAFNDKPAIIVGSGTASRDNTQNYLRNFSLHCTAPDYTNADCTGIEVHGTRACYLHTVIVANFRNCFSFAYDTFCTARECRALFSKVADDNTTTGFRINGQVESLYLRDNDITYVNAGSPNGSGIYINVPEGIQDLWIEGNSLTRCYNGIHIYGSATLPLQQDIFIIRNCIDNCIEAVRLSQKLKVVLLGNWISVGLYGSATARALHLVSFIGALSVIGNHFKSSDESTLSNIGYRFETAKNVVCKGNILNNFTLPVSITGCQNITFEDVIIKNNGDASGSGVIIEGSTNHCTIADSFGGDNKYNVGVQITGNCSYIRVNPQNILDANATTKVTIAGVAMTNSNAFQALANNNCIVGTL